MTKSIQLSDKVSIPVETYAIQGNTFVGIKETGKTYSATFMAEQLLDNGIPFVAFDPIGVWRHLKVPGRGKGYKVVVAGGKEPDLPLSPHSAPQIVKAAMEQNIPLIIDLFDVKISKNDWRTIVADSIKLLLHNNRTLRHVFIEEAPEFCPQRIQPAQGVVYAAVEAMARMGGNSSLGFTLIGQRTQEINKAVLELCDCIFLHRQKGLNSLKALKEWVEAHDTTAPAEVMHQIPRLGPGECFVWQAVSDPVFVKMPAKNSFHPDRRKPEAKRGIAQDVTSFVGKMSNELEKVIAEAKANDPTVLHRRIVELERQLAHQPKPQVAKPATIEKPVYLVGNKALDRLERLGDKLLDMTAKAQKELSDFKERLATLHQDVNAHRQTEDRKAPPLFNNPLPPQLPQSPPKPSLVITHGPSAEAGEVRGIHREILACLAQVRRPLSAKQVAVRIVKSHKGGYFLRSLGELKSQGYVVGDKASLQITDAGETALGSYEPLPTGPALLQHWVNEKGGLHADILKVVAANYPGTVPHTEVGALLNKAPDGGYFLRVLGELKTLELITGKKDALRATDEFFKA